MLLFILLEFLSPYLLLLLRQMLPVLLPYLLLCHLLLIDANSRHLFGEAELEENVQQFRAAVVGPRADQIGDCLLRKVKIKRKKKMKD